MEKTVQRRRVEMLQDCLAVLAEGTFEDASVVIQSLQHMECWGDLKALFRPVDYVVTTRAELAVKVAEIEKGSDVAS